MADASKLKRKNSLGAPPSEAEASPNLSEPEVTPVSPVLNLGQAARETGKSRSVIQNALKSGRLRGKYNDQGEWEIDADELLRMFSPSKPQDRASGSEKNPHVLLAFLQEQLRESQERVDRSGAREAQALERERESREREARLLSLLAAEQEARRCLEQQLLTAPPPLNAKSTNALLFLSGFLLAGSMGIAACFLYQGGLHQTGKAALAGPTPPSAGEIVEEIAPVQAISAPPSLAAPVEPSPAPSPPLPQEEVKTPNAESPLPIPVAETDPSEIPPASAASNPEAPTTIIAPEPPPSEIPPANAASDPEAPTTVIAPESPPSETPPQQRSHREPARQSWWWWWW